MSNSPVELSPVKRALLEIRMLKQRVAELEEGASEPIAITGMAIRTAGGVCDISDYAELLWSGRDAITTIPSSRWSLDQWYDPEPDAPGKMTTRYGGFIEDVDQFDAEFFGISPREAISMDPQQRLLLELAWHALEHAGHAPNSLAGSNTGIYLGIANSDYGRALFADTQRIDAYFGSGNAYSVAAGRLAYFLGTLGPAIAIDTACSSSLVALHLACQGLRQSECSLALAGGVNLILTPEYNVNFSKAGMMARDGRCKTFDAGADGYVRGEGAGLIVLRRLSDARQDGDRILALIRGSAVNQDGRSNGLTAPNGPAQVAVIRAALQAARIQPAEIGYIETHGTGTALGDPIEVNALATVFSADRNRGQPLLLGSVKTNIGHLEAAAGIAGIIKTVLALQRAEIPPHLHLRQPNPLIPWQSLQFAVPVQTTPWHPRNGTRLAGVSSFGFSGTNSHVILQQAPDAAQTPTAPVRDAYLLTISARTAAALREQAERYASLLSSAEAPPLAALCAAASCNRSHLPHRLGVLGASSDRIVAALRAMGRGEADPSLVLGRGAATPARVAFLFPGQGSQYHGMGRELYAGAQEFREAFDECADLLDAGLSGQVHDFVLRSEPGQSDDFMLAQPALFAIEVALMALWRSWGIQPAAVLGHSFGEYAAACAAGALSVANAARMVSARWQLVQGLPKTGSMCVIGAGEDAVLEAIEAQSGCVVIAAVNSPINTVISGERTAVEALLQLFTAQGVRAKALRISHAFHSPLMDPVLDPFQQAIAGIEFAEPTVALISSFTAQAAGLAVIGQPSYWRNQLRGTVRFAEAMRTLQAQGITHYLEVSPQPVLLGMASESIPDGAWLPSLRQGQKDWLQMLDTLRRLYCDGVDIDWQIVHGGETRRGVQLPAYPFQRKRYWFDLPAVGAAEVAVPAARTWEQIVHAMTRRAEQGPLDAHLENYAAKWRCLADLTLGHATEVLRLGGLFAAAGERRTLEEVMRVGGFVANYHHLVHRWLERLVERGSLDRHGDLYVAMNGLPAADMPRLWSAAEQALSNNQPLLAYLRNCGTLLPAVLNGKESPLETLFPGGSFELAQHLYEHSATMRYINTLAAAALETLAPDYSNGRALRVLEIGAGTGGTTGSLLPVLDPTRSVYCFTDVSATFLDNARRRFAAYPFVRYQLFDLEQPVTTQGYAEHSFDIVLAANAVHACIDLPAALQRLHSLLAPGGVLVLVESTVQLDWFDMSTGLIEGWQHFADDLRSDNPLLAPAAWTDALQRAGFVRSQAWPTAGSIADSLGQHLILAQVRGAPTAAALVEPTHELNIVPGDAVSATTDPQPWRQQLKDALPDERLVLLRDLVRTQVMRVLRIGADSMPGGHERLMDLGMDSLMAVQLRNALTKELALDRALPATLMFDFPTIDAIAAFLCHGLAPPTASHEPPAVTPTAMPQRGVRTAAEVAGMSDEQIALLLEQPRLSASLNASHDVN